MVYVATFKPNKHGMLFEHLYTNIKHMKPRKETTRTDDSQSDAYVSSNAPAFDNKMEGAGKEVITNEYEQKKRTNKDNDDDPDPVKVPNKHEEPAKDPGDPVINPGEKEKNKEKVPVNHPGNKS
jgi:hypothetical protein